ncbi:hypothetical protein [Prochlorothrix hollandica]|uniref:hypothetical protein n=1 Tax=Prochlorothrix hollandica TaxID=1223 RepID=UPI00034548E7|nr:hypothetical protein [Prochlorothrix hollandica]
MKYFFLTDEWTIGRVWELGGLWNSLLWRRSPIIEPMGLALIPGGSMGSIAEGEASHGLRLYRVEDAVFMLEVNPPALGSGSQGTIGRVMLKKLITAEQVFRAEQGFRSLADRRPSAASLHDRTPECPHRRLTSLLTLRLNLP